MINVSVSQLDFVKTILQKYVPSHEIRVFGSRIGTTVKDYSDLDLVIVGKEKLQKNILAALKEDFEQSDLPFRVDVLDWNALSTEFKGVISKQYEILQTPS